MSHHIAEGQWRQMRGQMKNWWGKLTDNDLDRVQGNMDILAGLLQEKYGYTKAQAETEVNRRMNEYKMGQSSTTQSKDRRPGQHTPPA